MLDDDDMNGGGGAGENEIDPDLPVLDRIERYCASGSLVQRLVFVREVASCAEDVGAAETVGRIVPLLKVIICDPEQQVRQVSRSAALTSKGEPAAVAACCKLLRNAARVNFARDLLARRALLT